ncbi:MAG: hypothetical protein U1C70_05925 [Sediminibacterium sp.]|jgi:hypothetical protein|uniref:hypothetical protein n=1 Tax=Sediminibacterium sp. TaxID=1917865 RepID=UPI002AB97EE7|nr:hypothetical protein [Sediminibacterium sp.]MDZ4071344.1 hypothetical protein [Sediminibacterium sp.]
MKKQLSYLMVALLMVTFVATGCKKDPQKPENEEELITTLRLTFTEVGGTATSTVTFKDADGPGGNAPTQNEQIILAPNKQYNCTVQVLDESKSPAKDITIEINAEANDHQFYFQPNGVNITINGLNTDPNGRPLGVTSRWNCGAVSGPGTVKVTLKHKPGSKGSNDPVTVGETDIEVNFVARIQ